MLVLARRSGETLIINDNIEVTILGVQGNQVRFGINAPREIPVHREEVYRCIKAAESRTVEFVSPTLGNEKVAEVRESQTTALDRERVGEADNEVSSASAEFVSPTLGNERVAEVRESQTTALDRERVGEADKERVTDSIATE